MADCDRCGFHYRLAEAEAAGPRIRTGAAALAALLGRAGAGVRTRPAADVWSPLEYACHVRDMLLVQRERVLLVRREDRPRFTPMGRDERVEHDGYADQRPDDVARQLTDAAALFANVLARLGPDDWERTATYNYPVVEQRSLRWIAEHTRHEVAHHLLDVQNQPT